MTNQHGDFIWYELLTSDADAAGAFYGKVVGWTSTSAGQPGMDYRFFSSGDGSDDKDGVGGYMAITPEMAAGGARPAWVGYICVDDVDQTITKLTAAGGSVMMPASDIAGVGRMAMVADPQGAPFYVMKGASEGGESHSFAALDPKVGHCAWNELSSADPEVAKSFYGKLFGWVKDGDMDMGPLGKYEFLKVNDGRFALGAVMPKMPEMPVSMWTFSFRVADIDKAVETIKDCGGQLLQEPMEIPGGDFSLTAMDPQGAALGLVGPKV
jgi:predicted enzyme related to lactoylglutathione lyase